MTYIRGWRRGAIVEYRAKNWEKESGSLSRTCLSTGHEVTPTGDNGNGILLYWGGPGVLSKLRKSEVENKIIMKQREREGGGGGGGVISN